MIMVREENDPPPEGVEYKHGLTPPMRDARRRRFRREPDLNVFELAAFLLCLFRMCTETKSSNSFLRNIAGRSC